MSASTGLSRVATVIRWVGGLCGAAIAGTTVYLMFAEPGQMTLWHLSAGLLIGAGIYACFAAVAWVVDGFAGKRT